MQRAGAFGVACGVRCVGFGLHQACAGLRHIGLNTLGREGGQHLAGPHGVTHIHAYLKQAQPRGFTANDGFLPGGDIAIGTELDGQLALLGLHDHDRQRGLGLGCLFVVRRARLGGKQACSPREYC